MYTKRVEKGLTLIGAIIMLFGVLSAINTALADEAAASHDALKSAVTTTN